MRTTRRGRTPDHDVAVTIYLTRIISDSEWALLAGDRNLFASGRLDADSQSLLDAISPGWNQPARERSWNRQALDAIDHRKRTGAHASTTAKNESERLLGRWLSAQRGFDQRTDRRRLSDDRRSFLDENYLNWRGESSNEAWERNARLCAQFRADCGRHPSKSASQNINKGSHGRGILPPHLRERWSVVEEKRLATWIIDRRREARPVLGTLSMERRSLLDAIYPDWLDTEESPDRDTYRAIVALLEFADANGRRPSLDSGDPRERELASLVHEAGGEEVEYSLSIKEKRAILPLVLRTRWLPQVLSA